MHVECIQSHVYCSLASAALADSVLSPQIEMPVLAGTTPGCKPFQSLLQYLQVEQYRVGLLSFADC